MIKFFCFAVICFTGAQAGRYAVQRNHVLRNHAQVQHGADLHELEDVPEATHDHSKHKFDHQVDNKYDHQFDEIIEDNSYYQNVHNKGFYGPTYPPSYGHNVYKKSSGHSLETYGRTFDIKSDFYNDHRNRFDQKHVPAMYAPKVFKAEKVHSYAAPASVDVHGYTSPAVVHDSRVYAPASVLGAHGDAYSHGVGYGEMLDNTPVGYSLHSGSHRLITKQPVKFKYNNARAVVDTHSPKGYGLEAYVDSKGYDNEVLYSRQGYGVPVKGYVHAHGDDYKFSGYNTPTTTGHYVGYGNKYDFRHGYPYGYGEMLDMTSAGYSLHSGSHRLMTKQPTKYEFNYAKNDNNYAQTHGLVDAVSSIKDHDNEVYSSRQGYVAPVKGYAHGDDYKFSGYNTPTTTGHYVGYGNKYDFRHGYPYGYGEMLDKTPAGYSLHSESNRLITKQPAKYSYNQGYLQY